MRMSIKTRQLFRLNCVVNIPLAAYWASPAHSLYSELIPYPWYGILRVQYIKYLIWTKMTFSNLYFTSADVVKHILQQAGRHVALNQTLTVLVCVMVAVLWARHSWTTTTPSACQSWPLLCSLRSKRGSKGQAKIRRWQASQHLVRVVLSTVNAASYRSHVLSILQPPNSTHCWDGKSATIE